MFAHVENVTCAQRDASSVDSVLFSSEANTRDLLAPTDDSVANSVAAEGIVWRWTVLGTPWSATLLLLALCHLCLARILCLLRPTLTL